MLKQIIAPLSIVALLAFGCNKSAKTMAAAASSEIKGKTFGKEITAKGAVSYDAMLSKMGTAAKLDNVKVEGTVEAVCQAKGCWMNISSEKGAPSMHVDFKDYAFFMPKDLAGKKVVMLGHAVKEVTSVENLRHFAADAGKTKEDIAKITQPKEDIKFLAEGVLIIN
jgi:hypothetical protein